MFTDRIMRDYCQQIREVEAKMEAGYREIAEKITHEGYKRFFEGMAEQEQSHQGQIDSLISLFTEG